MQVIHTSDQGQLPLIPVTMAGQTSWWLIDTGSSHNLISPALVKSQQLPVISSSIITTIGGQRPSTHHLLPVMTIGNLRLDGQSASMATLNGLARPASLHIAGILGMPALRNLVVTLDFQRHTVTFAKRLITDSSYYTHLPLALNDGIPVAKLAIPGMGNGRFILDTGNATALTILPKLSRPNVPNNLTFIEETDLGGKIPTRLANIPRLRLGRNSFQQIPVSLPLKSQRIDKVDGSIGNRILGQQTIIFDFPSKKLWLENKRPTTLPGAFGFLLAADNIVQTILPNSSAQQAGMLPGDKIVAINGQILGANAHKIWQHIFNRNTVNISVLRNGNTIPMALIRSYYLPNLH